MLGGPVPDTPGSSNSLTSQSHLDLAADILAQHKGVLCQLGMRLCGLCQHGVDSRHVSALPLHNLPQILQAPRLRLLPAMPVRMVTALLPCLSLRKVAGGLLHTTFCVSLETCLSYFSGGQDHVMIAQSRFVNFFVY